MFKLMTNNKVRKSSKGTSQVRTLMGQLVNHSIIVLVSDFFDCVHETSILLLISQVFRHNANNNKYNNNI